MDIILFSWAAKRAMMGSKLPTAEIMLSAVYASRMYEYVVEM
jgi:hypothetical protein